MGKKSKKQESGKTVSASALKATAIIAALAVSSGITLTDTNAVLKDLRPGVKTEVRYTRWGKNADGARVLVVLDVLGKSINAYEDYASKYPLMKTVSL